MMIKGPASGNRQDLFLCALGGSGAVADELFKIGPTPIAPTADHDRRGKVSQRRDDPVSRAMV